MIQESIEYIFEFARNGASIKQKDTQTGIPITRIETIWNRSIDVDRFGYANLVEIGKYDKYLLQHGDILMSHINSPKHLGKVALYKGIPEDLVHGMNLLCLRNKKDISFSNYLYYFFNSSFFTAQLNKISNQSVNQASFSSGNLKKLKIPLPPLEEQKRIAAILDAADEVRQKNKALIEKYNQLTQSLFLDMFGDPVANNNGYEIVSLSSYGEFKNGLNFARNEKGHSIKYLGVGNFKSKVKIENIDTLSNIDLTNLPNEGYFLNDGDLVFVRSNGNKALVGRCIAIYPKNEKVTFHEKGC